MSLLLDALKKAADDKEKSSRRESSVKKVVRPNVDPVESTPAVKVKPVLQPIGKSPVIEGEVTELQDNKQPNIKLAASARKTGEDSSDAEPLTLDLEATDELSLADDGAADTLVVADKNVEHSTAAVVDESVAPAKPDNESPVRKNNEHSAASKLTVSDDALSLLINKTNRDEKRSKIIFTISVIFISLLILGSGGLYYYTDMQEEIAALERKHQIAMQQMRAKTNNEQTPEKTAIIRNLVSDAKLEEKVQYAKEQVSKDKTPVSTHQYGQTEPVNQKDTATKNTVDTTKKNRAALGDLTIRKTKKSDPVGENLDAAWLAYDGGNYEDAKRLYRKVLKIEDSNRDAQLGLGAIAVIEKDNTRARRIYLALLQLDPRDPIATAALAELNSNKESLASDNDYLLSLLEKNPDAPHLNFSVGNNYAQQKKWKSAQKHYFRAWQHDSDNADYLFNLAVSLDQLGKPQQAINFYRDSLVKASNKQVSFSVAAVQKRIDELSGL